MNSGARTRDASARINPMANPGNTYADVDGCSVIVFPPLDPQPGGGTNGGVFTRAAKTHRPPVAAYASAAVHSLMPSCLESANINGASFSSPMVRSTSWLNTRCVDGSSFPSSLFPASAPSFRARRCLRTPMSAVGFTARIASNTVLASATPSCAYGSLCSARSGSFSARSRVTSPLLSTKKIFLRASTTVDFGSLVVAMYSAIMSPMPVPVSPAPAMRYVCSLALFPVLLSAAMIPASVLAATPWMSSLNAVAELTYRSSRRFPFRFEKSSNCTTVRSPNRRFTAAMNSSMRSSYTSPVIRSVFVPMYNGSFRSVLLFVPTSTHTASVSDGCTPPNDVYRFVFAAATPMP
mmetsp:Transcript_5080/g.18142  ORF Transcript_5080/g.18142 Transcript_5080/m.18142 type:complete len:351 (+) Transcript_5080:1257-2309(+)